MKKYYLCGHKQFSQFKPKQMSSKQLNCPSCGAPVELKYRFSKMAVCGYCGQSTHLTNENLEAKGDSTPLTDYGSKFSVGQEISLKGEKFEIVGRIRFTYPSGFWDEWFLINDKNPETEYWLQEDEGDYILFGRADDSGISFPDFTSTQVGSTQQYADEAVFVSEKNTAEIMGGEGELPFQVVKGEQANFIDGIVVGKGTPVSYEYLPKETLLYVGFEVQLDDISIRK